MGKPGSVLTLLAGLSMAAALHGATRANSPQDGRALAYVAAPQMTSNAAWPAPLQAPVPWGSPQPADVQPAELAGGLNLIWPDGKQLRIGMADTSALERLQAAPVSLSGSGLLHPWQYASLDNRLRLDLAPAPEPQSWAMFMAGMLLVGGQVRRHQKAPKRPYLATL